MSLTLAYIYASVFKIVTFTTIVVGQHLNLPINSTCRLSNGDIGICKRLYSCASAKEMLMHNIRPVPCSYEGNSPFLPIVCCVPGEDLPNDPSLISLGVSNKNNNNPTTERNPTTEINLNQSDKPIEITEKISSGGLGEKTIQKCNEYKNILYEKPKTPETPTTTIPNTPEVQLINGHKFISGGIDAKPREFPHVALLGFGDSNDTQWLCGGALISENFILTAAHCLSSELYGQVKLVRLGEFDLRSNTEDAYALDYEVEKVFEYPEYRPDIKYHDVALIQLKTPAQFNIYTKPACISVEKELPKDLLVVAGWGRVYFSGTHPDRLQKVNLTFTEDNICTKTYTTKTHGLGDGVKFDSQICAEGAEEGGDTCQGDSGTPLQYYISDYDQKLYQVVGITSFGIQCGIAPAIYTKVSFYIPWIENIVWP